MRTTPQLATCLALSEVNPTAFRRRASADLPCLLACEDEVEPFLLHDECFFCRTPEATALTSILLHLTLLKLSLRNLTKDGIDDNQRDVGF